MPRKRYKEDAALIERLATVGQASVAQARRVFIQLLASRFGDVIEIGVTREARYTLKHESTDEEIGRWQKELQQRVIDDVRHRQARYGDQLLQGVRFEHALISTTSRGIALDVDAELGELLAMQTYILLRSVGREQVRLCDCGKVFVRTGKRQHCSERCQKRVYMRKFRTS